MIRQIGPMRPPHTDGGVVLQQQLAAVGGAAHHGRVIEWSEASAVLVVWRCPEVQQSLRTRRNNKNAVMLKNEQVL